MTTLDLAQIVIRRGTASQWTIADPILGSGEFGLETDTKLVKLGDGTSLWSALTYQGPQLAAQINLATAKTTPLDADTFPLSDSAAANGLKKLTWANLKATLKIYFDTLYSAVATTVTLTGTQTLTNKTIASPVVTGLYLGDGSIVFEGAVADAFETSVTVQEPTADRTITLPNLSGTVELTDGYTTTATAGATTVLTVASTKRQVFTGTLAQIVTMPVVSTLPELGYPFKVINDSTGIVTVNSSGGNLIYAVPAGVTVDFICILITGTTDSSWLADYPAVATVALVGCTALAAGVTVAFTNGVATIIPYATENFDTDGFHSNVTNNSRLTIPAGKAGKYLLTAQIGPTDQLTNYAIVNVYLNGANMGQGIYLGRIKRTAPGAYASDVAGTGVFILAAGDYVEIGLTSDWTTGNKTITSQFSLIYLGA